MSRCYGMDVSIDGIPRDKILEVKKALEDVWFESISIHEFSNSDNDTCYFEKYHESTLCGGESEEEFADRLIHAVWDTCGCFVSVIVMATSLENQPYNEYELDEYDYDTYININAKKKGIVDGKK